MADLGEPGNPKQAFPDPAAGNPEASTLTAPAATVRLSFPPTEQPGTRIGRYKLLQQIGEGGCGVVYMAEQKDPVQRRVALKVIKLGMDTKEVIARFEAERQALAMMDHPNIAKVLDAGATESGRPYFVMELVRGIRITDYCDQNQLSTPDRLGLFTQVCHAVQHAHQKGIIHRDLKPSNILVTLHDGVPVPKVIDFGIAKATTGQALTDKTVFTAFEQFIGTPAYMSPEQAEMSGLDIDTRSDIYALGVLLYELLTGRTPFDAKTLLAKGLDEIRRIIREEEPPRPSTRLSTLDAAEQTLVAKQRHSEPPKLRGLLRGDLDWIVMKALEKDRTRRYETANGLARDIGRHLNNEPVVARPPNNFYRLQKLVGRNKLAFAAGAAVAVALMAGVTVSTWMFVGEKAAREEAEAAEERALAAEQAASEDRDRAIDAKKEAELARQNEMRLRQKADEKTEIVRLNLYLADMKLAARAWEIGNLERVSELLERNRPGPGQTDLRGWEWRALAATCRNDDLVTLGQHDASITTLAVSPDGKLVASGGHDAEIKLWDLPSRQLLARFHHADWVTSVSFSPNGKLLASCAINFRTDSHSFVILWDVAKGQEYCRFEGLNNANRQAVFSVDGRTLAVLGSSKVRLYDLDSKEEKRRIPALQANYFMDSALAISPDGDKLAVGVSDGDIHLFETATGRLLIKFHGHSDYVRTLAFSLDGKVLASGSKDKTIRIWDVTHFREIAKLSAHKAEVNAVAISPDGTTVASAGADQTIHLWSAATRQEIGVLTGHSNTINAVGFTLDGQTLITGSQDQTLRLWNLAGQEVMPERISLPVGIKGWSLAPNGKTLVAWQPPHAVAVYDTSTFREQSRFDFPTLEVVQAAVTSDRSRLALLAANGGLMVWDCSQEHVLASLDKLEVPTSLSRLAFSPDGRSLMFGTSSRNLKLWDVSSQSVRCEISWPEADCKSYEPVFSPDARLLAIPGLSGFISLWDTQTGRLQAFFRPHQEAIRAMVFSPDSKVLATGSEDGYVRLWDPFTTNQLASLSNFSLRVRDLDFSPDGHRLLAVAMDGSVTLWDMADFQEIVTLNLLKGQDIFFSDDNTLISSAGTRDFLRLRAPTLMEIDATDKADAFMPMDPGQWQARVKFFERKGRWADGLQVMDSVINRQPKNPQAWEDKALLLARHNQFDEAERACSKAAELAAADTNHFSGVLNSALVHRAHFERLRLAESVRLYEAQGQPDKAAEWKTKLSEFDKAAAVKNSGEATALFKKVTDQSKFPVRGADTKPQLIDLSHYYNVSLNARRHPQYPDRTLASLPSGVQKFGDVEFDVRGTIQLNGGYQRLAGMGYPNKVDGVVIQQRCHRLHFLHATMGNSGLLPGTSIGSYIVHYADGQTADYPLNLRSNIDYFASSKTSGLAMIWREKEPGRAGVYKAQWENPRPEVEVASLDFHAAKADCAPFLVAITAEP